MPHKNYFPFSFAVPSYIYPDGFLENLNLLKDLVDEIELLFFEGSDLRLLVVGDQVVSTLKREPAYVIGNGHDTIRQLIHAFNIEWHSAVKYELPLCPIPLDSEVTRYLERLKLTLDSIVPAGQKTQLRWNANVSTGGRAIDVTDQVHPKIKELAVRVAKLSDLEIGGVDIMCKNYETSDISADNVTILEINDSPGLDIHPQPYDDHGRDIDIG